MPEWVSKHNLRVFINDHPVEAMFGGERSIEFTGLQKNAFIRIEYPLPQRDGAEEVCGRAYKVQWKGDTVVGIQPKGQLYPLYERAEMMSPNAPLVDWPYDRQQGGPVHW
jgi:hypothetical protein